MRAASLKFVAQQALVELPACAEPGPEVAEAEPAAELAPESAEAEPRGKSDGCGAGGLGGAWLLGAAMFSLSSRRRAARGRPRR